MSQVAHTGAHAAARVAELLDRSRAQRVFLVTGRESYASCGAKAALRPALAGRAVLRFTEFAVNPRAEDIERGVALLREHGADIVIAVGGGSVLDMAKLVCMCAASDASVVDHILGREFDRGGVPLIAVPTTAGSGAEATHFAVAYIDKHKYSVTDLRMRPTHAVLDAGLTASLSPALTASTGVDVISQAIEAYWSVKSTEESREYAVRAATGAREHLVAAVERPTPAARDAMLTSANLAGKAIDITRTTAPHALSYAFTIGWGVPHGHAVGLTLGAVFQHNLDVSDADSADPRGAAFVRERMADLRRILGDTADDLRGFVAGLGLETRLRGLGIARSDLPEISRAVNEQRLKNNPRRLDAETIGRILEAIY